MISLRLSLLFAILIGILAIIYEYEITASFMETNIFNNDIDTTHYHENGFLFNQIELGIYDGIKNKQLFLAILGVVYDVSRSATHYGPGNTYHVFTGKDASRSFVTGDFDGKGVSDDVVDLVPEELLSLKRWQQFYEKEYTYKGKLIGKYYNEKGQATQYKIIVDNLIKNAEENKNEDDLDEKIFPPCNIEWTEKDGTRVWCSDRSGGIERNWAGVPRKYFRPGSTTHRCACLMNQEKTPQVEFYENCKSDSGTCYILT